MSTRTRTPQIPCIAAVASASASTSPACQTSSASGCARSTSRAAQVRVDLRHGVPLACVSLRKGECDDWVFDRWIEAVRPAPPGEAQRRAVRSDPRLRSHAHQRHRLGALASRTKVRSRGTTSRNRSDTKTARQERPSNLNELLGRILATGAQGHRARRLLLDDHCGAGGAEAAGASHAACRSSTSKPVDAPAPLTGSSRAQRSSSMPPGSTTPSRAATDLQPEPSAVEIEVRGDFIVDCNGQTVDANAVGLSPAPTGNGTPGGTFLSSFHVTCPAIRGRGIMATTIRIELKEPKS